MSQRDLDTVISIYPLGAEDFEEGFDLGGLIQDPDWQRKVENIFQPDARIRFVTPPSSGIRIMDQDTFEGPQGLAEGWRVWMQPWESFRITFQDLIDAGDGQVLLLAEANAKLRDSGVEIPQETCALHRVEDGKIAGISFYLDQDQARLDAGLG